MNQCIIADHRKGRKIMRETAKEKAIILAGYAILIICTFLPYIKVEFLGQSVSSPLIGADGQIGDGILFIIIAVVGILFTLMDKMGVVLVSTGLAAILTIVEIVNFSKHVNGDVIGSMYQRGIGFYMMIIGAVVTVVGLVLERKNA